MKNEVSASSRNLKHELGYKIIKYTLLAAALVTGCIASIYWLTYGVSTGASIVWSWISAELLTHKANITPVMQALANTRAQILVLSGIFIWSVVHKLKHLVEFYEKLTSAAPLSEDDIRKSIKSMRFVISMHTPYGLAYGVALLNLALLVIASTISVEPWSSAPLVYGGIAAAALGFFSYLLMCGETIQWVLPTEMKLAYQPVRKELDELDYFEVLIGHSFRIMNYPVSIGYMGWLVLLLARRAKNNSEESVLINAELNRYF
ncbi:hypothetical protein [Comamonas thiooxydans]|uniref:hypothetical protein n=1 Tax=Comamonas thiooxydans TaxID=363952 RepID=UPI001184D246|nr:hypothetical protein [Comamonas thiooxydans]